MTSVFAIVTEGDRRDPCPVDAEHCPIARAAARALKAVLGRPITVLVSNRLRVIVHDAARPGLLGGMVAAHFDVPLDAEALAFVDDFDSGRIYNLPRVLVVEIPIPDDLPPPDRRLMP